LFSFVKMGYMYFFAANRDGFVDCIKGLSI